MTLNETADVREQSALMEHGSIPDWVDALRIAHAPELEDLGYRTIGGGHRGAARIFIEFNSGRRQSGMQLPDRDAGRKRCASGVFVTTVEMLRQLLVPPRDTRVQPGRDLVHAPLFAFVKAWNSAMSNG